MCARIVRLRTAEDTAPEMYSVAAEGLVVVANDSCTLSPRANIAATTSEALLLAAYAKPASADSLSTVRCFQGPTKSPAERQALGGSTDSLRGSSHDTKRDMKCRLTE
jgi:hypothetical protein